ncbi:MAG: AlwI family type II restriction endonuclease [Helicobacter sp.]|nr:AlwI family type II restriction endonuclease [Helicobacter sp.]
MRYDYFGNTSLRVKNLLYNFETQLILFEELFNNADEKDKWSSNSDLQIKYLELLEQHNLLESKNKTADLGTKDARVKSAPLEDYNLINRRQKYITQQGYELLNLIKSQSHKIENDFLQIDLISLFFLKATLNFNHNSSLLIKYLEVFRHFNGQLSIENFRLLPLINNFRNAQDFIGAIQNNTLMSNILYNTPHYLELECFLNDLQNNTVKIEYFKTAKGEKTAGKIVKVLKDIFLPFRKTGNIELLHILLTSHVYTDFKNLYLRYLIKGSKKEEKIKELSDFCNGTLEEFGKRFFRFIFESRIQANLNDYLDLNRRYLNLTGIFEFHKDKVDLNIIFSTILKHSKYQRILEQIAQSNVSQNLLDELFDDKEMKQYFRELGITHLQDIKSYKQYRDREKLQELLQTRFTREHIIEILELFSDRNNDSRIHEKTTTEATIPTIFEYIIAIAWCYIDENKIERILEAGLSLDSQLLPKSHAVGGNADFVYSYYNHSLMIEVTLTEKTNQRRAEMESVSRHLGNLLLSLNSTMREKTYGIFIAPYLDKNVINDFRSRIHCYFENDTAYIKGMKILPLSTEDIIRILKSHVNYKDIFSKFQEILSSKELWGNQWYQTHVQMMIENMKN